VERGLALKRKPLVLRLGRRGPVKLLAPGLRRQARSMKYQKLRRWKP
jgi:hypothetical protein